MLATGPARARGAKFELGEREAEVGATSRSTRRACRKITASASHLVPDRITLLAMSDLELLRRHLLGWDGCCWAIRAG